MHTRLLTLGSLLGLFGLVACKDDLCVGEPASLQLDLIVADSDIARRSASVLLIVRAGELGWQHTIPVGAQLADQASSLALVLDPAPSGPYTLRIDAQLFDESNRPLAIANLVGEATPDGCNRFPLAFTAGGAIDGGVGDGGLDAGVAPFGYVPSNFDPAQLSPGVALVITGAGCIVIFDSSPPTPSFTNMSPSCAMFDRPTPQIVSGGGVEHVVLAVTRLEVGQGARLQLRGSRPVVFAVFGDARIDGTLSATADLDVPGAGGSIGARCTVGSADRQQRASTNGAGGGGGAFGGAGATGGHDSAGTGRGLGGSPELPATLVPMRGGCPGGDGAGNAGGAGGGALQISAAGALITGTSGRVTAGGGGGPRGDEGDGGTGGGSGGGILLEADRLNLFGNIFANGGGGAGGGGTGDHGDDGENGDRADPNGGNGGPALGGEGGDGSGSTPAPTAGDASAGVGGGGGGGGGGAGVIILRGITNCTRMGTTSPVAMALEGC